MPLSCWRRMAGGSSTSPASGAHGRVDHGEHLREVDSPSGSGRRQRLRSPLEGGEGSSWYSKAANLESGQRQATDKTQEMESPVFTPRRSASRSPRRGSSTLP